MQVTFAYPWVLLLLWLIPALGLWHLFVHRRYHRDLGRFVAPVMQKRLLPPALRARSAWQSGLLLVSLFFLIVALARPQWGTQETTLWQRGRDVMILLDVSRSMLAPDVHPSRLQRAKADLLDLIEELRGDRAGLMVFRFKPVLLCPLTTDYAFLRHALEAADVDAAPRGQTNIGDAILSALDAFDDREGSHKVILLISDGEDLAGKAVEAAQRAGEKGIPIFAVGLGDPQGARIPIKDGERTGVLTYQGETVISRMQAHTLHAVAEASRGAYLPIGTASTSTLTLGELYRNVRRKIAQQEFEETLRRRRAERYTVFLLPGLLGALGVAFLSRGRLVMRSGPRQQGPTSSSARAGAHAPSLKDLTPPSRPLKNITIGFLAFGLASVAVSADTQKPSAPEFPTNTASVTMPETKRLPGRAEARRAQRLYALGRYEAAAQVYETAARGLSGRARRDCLYNAAVAFYQAGRYADAARMLQELDTASGGGDTAVPGALGAARYREAQQYVGEDVTNCVEKARLMRDAAEAFRRAARSKAENDNARHDLAFVLEQLPDVEEKAKIARLLQEYGTVPASELARRLLIEQRQILAEAKAAL